MQNVTSYTYSQSPTCFHYLFSFVIYYLRHSGIKNDNNNRFVFTNHVHVSQNKHSTNLALLRDGWEGWIHVCLESWIAVSTYLSRSVDDIVNLQCTCGSMWTVIIIPTIVVSVWIRNVSKRVHFLSEHLVVRIYVYL